MYGVPANLDLRGFHGGRLDQICVGTFQVQFSFSNSHTISVEGSWRVVDARDVVVDESVSRVGDRASSQSLHGFGVRVLLDDTVDDGCGSSQGTSCGYRESVVGIAREVDTLLFA
jgi:hypothetical protein